MVCQSCKERKATVHLTEIIGNKEKRELHLCEQCAQAHGTTGMEIMGLISSAFGPAAKAAGAGTETTDVKCAACGLAYSEFRSRGRLGCPQCYDVFRPQLESLLEKIHGNDKHVGKIPGGASAADRSREKRLVALRRQLHAAVKGEDYELAAKLRDDLKRAEADADEPDADR
jgi:protein arginine kinase activator